MFENDPKVVVNLNYESKANGIVLKEKFSIKPFQTKTVKSGENSKCEFEYKIRYSDQLRFTNFAVFEFNFFQVFGEKSESVPNHCA